MANISFEQFEAQVALCAESTECPFRGATAETARRVAEAAFFHYDEQNGMPPLDEEAFRQKVEAIGIGACLAEAGIDIEPAAEAEEMGQLIQFPTRRK